MRPGEGRDEESPSDVGRADGDGAATDECACVGVRYHSTRKRKRSFGDGSVGPTRPPPPRIRLRRPMRRPRTVSLPARRKRAMETDDRSIERSDAAVGTTSGRWARVAGWSRPGSPRSRNKQTNHLARTRAPALIRSLCNVCVSVSSSSARATSRAFYHMISRARRREMRFLPGGRAREREGSGEPRRVLETFLRRRTVTSSPAASRSA